MNVSTICCWDSLLLSSLSFYHPNGSWKICSLAVNGQSFLVIDGYLLNSYRLLHLYHFLFANEVTYRISDRCSFISVYRPGLTIGYQQLFFFSFISFQRPFLSVVGLS